MSTGIPQLCRTSVRNTRALKLKSISSIAQSRSLATKGQEVRRVVTRRTHFLTLPLYEGPTTVCSKMAELRQLWRQGAASANLEPGIIIPSMAHALSLKLGNINIKGWEGISITARFNPDSPQPQGEPHAFELSEVTKVMQELKEPIRQLLTSQGATDVLRVQLGRCAPLLHGLPTNFNPRKVNVLFLQPAAGNGYDIVTAISQLVHEKFSSLGMLAGAPSQPAGINLTLINTANRSDYVPAQGRTRKPFNLEALYRLQGFNAFRPDSTDPLPERLEAPLELDLGIAEVRSLKLDRVTPGLPSDEVKPKCDAEVTFAI